MHIKISKTKFLFHKNSVNIFILGLSYYVDFFPKFSPSYILYIICVDSEESWSDRSLIECTIYSEEVIPNLFQQAGDLWHKHPNYEWPTYTHTYST